MEPDWTAEMKSPLWLPPTRAMSASRFSPSRDSSCTGFREALLLEKEDRDGRNGLEEEEEEENKNQKKKKKEEENKKEKEKKNKMKEEK